MEKTTIFLLKDVISFWGIKNLSNVFDAIDLASNVGTKTTGWMIGQEGDEILDWHLVYGDGLELMIVSSGSLTCAWLKLNNLDSAKKTRCGSQAISSLVKSVHLLVCQTHLNRYAFLHSNIISMFVFVVEAG